MRRAVLPTLVLACLLAGCADTRPATTSPIPTPIGRGREFRPPPGTPRNVPCTAGRLEAQFGVHLELFAERKVVIVPAGIGVAPPRRLELGRLVGGRCRSSLRTLDPTGVVVFDRVGLRLAQFFSVWGRPFTSRRLLSFEARPGSRVVAFVNGVRWRGDVRAVPLRDGEEIVVEINGYVPPHRSYEFPAG